MFRTPTMLPSSAPSSHEAKAASLLVDTTYDDTNNVIIGIGPTGLAFAIATAMSDSKKRKVIALTDRTEYNRTAIFRLDADIFPFLEELVGKEKIQEYFNKKLIGPKQTLNGWDFHVIQIMTFEKLLFERLQQLPNVEIIKLPKRSASQIKAIDTKAHTIKLSLEQKDEKSAEERTFKFKHLIGTDGKHQLCSQIEECKVEYHSTQHEQLYDKHARVVYKLPEDCCSTVFRQYILPSSEVKDENSKLLYNLGWKLKSIPEVRTFTIDGYVFAAAECPQHFSTSDEAIIDRWIRAILERTCPKAIVSKLEKLDTAVFTTDLEEANCTLVPLPGCDISEDPAVVHERAAYFIQAGDSLRKTHYQTGSGAVVGLRQAQAWKKFMSSSQTIKDLIEFHAEVANIRAENRMRVDKFIDGRIAREEQALGFPSPSFPRRLLATPESKCLEHEQHQSADVHSVAKSGLTRGQI